MKNFVFENDNFRLTVGENAITESLIYKKNGEELLDFDKYEEVLSEITPETLQQAFNQYLHPERAILLYIGEYKK